MNKNPFFFVFTSLLLVSASFGVSFANAADPDPGDGLQFCFLETTNPGDNKPRLDFSQKTSADTKASGEVCFDSWFNESGASSDAYTFISTWLSKSANAEAYVYVTSNIEFAGYDSSTDNCVDGKNAFKGKMLSLKVGQTLTGGTSFRTITGLCDISSEEKVGFVQLYGKMEYLNFNQAYFKSTATKSRVGIVPVGGSTTEGNIISNCRVEHSKFFGVYVGALLGEGLSQFESIEINDVSVEGLSVGTEDFYIGGIAGRNEAVEKNAGSSFSTGYFIKDIVLDNVSLKAPEPNGHEMSIGGIAGSIALKLKSSFSDISVRDLIITNGSLDGGVFGRMSYDGSENPSGNEHKVTLENISILGKRIGSSRNAGGLVGEIQGGSLPGAVEIRKIVSNTDIAVRGIDADLLGGLVAFVQHSSTKKMDLEIRYTYSIGNLRGIDSYKSGYLIAGLDTAKFNFRVSDNYHYGTDDIFTKTGITAFYDEKEVDKWRNPPAPVNVDGSGSVIRRNFRNEIISRNVENMELPEKSLYADGNLRYDSKEPIYESANGMANGVVKSKDMKTQFFAALMNIDNAVWTQKDDENDDLPIFAGASYKPNCWVSIDQNSFNDKASQYNQNALNEALGSRGALNGRYWYGGCTGCFAFITNSDGKLDESIVDVLNNVTDINGVWVSDSIVKLNASTVYDNSQVKYSYARVFSIVNHFCKDDGNAFCDSGTDVIIKEKEGEKINGYMVNYMLAPVQEFISNDTNAFVPPFMISDDGVSVYSVLPSFYEIEPKSQAVSPKTGAIMGGLKKFVELLPDIDSLDYTNEYENKIHLYYIDENGVKKNIPFANGSDITMAVKGFGYDADGKRSKQISNSQTVDGNKNVEIPLASGYTVDFEDVVGYQFVGWKLEFGLNSNFKNGAPVNATEKYITTLDEFTSHYNDRIWVLQNLSASDTVYMDSVYKGLSSINGVSSDDFMMRISPSVTPIDYEVTFDFKSATASKPLIVFSDSWASSLKRTMNLDAERVFPRSYIYSTSEEKFYPIVWSYKARDQFNFSVDPISTVAFKELTSKLLENALGGDTNVTGITLYPINPEGDNYFGEFDPTTINIYAYDADGNPLTDANDYHGSIVLSQAVGNTTIQQKSSLFYSSDYWHVLYLPDDASDDTLTFDVSFEPEPGYTIVVNKYNFDSKKLPENEFWGYDADSKKLRISTKNMSTNSFEIQYKPNGHYNMEFTIPESMRDKDFFVANKKVAADKYEADWFTKQENVTVENVKAPPLYNSDGCRIYWKPENDVNTALDIKEELQYLVSIEDHSDYVNTLIPDIDHPDCSVGAVSPTTQRIELDRSGDGELTIKQRLPYEPQVPSDPGFIEIKHSFIEDASGNLYLDLPRVLDGDGNDLGVKVTMEANSNDGYIFDVLYENVGTSGQILQNGDEYDVMNGLSLSVSFAELKPVYVAFNLSLNTSTDSAATYLPVNAVAVGSFKMEKEKDSVDFWIPFRTDKSFRGWSTTKADVFVDGDPRYTLLDATNYVDFSKDENAPTQLYALWEEKQMMSPMQRFFLKNGDEHTKLALYQLFGDDTLHHVVPDAGISFEQDAFDFYIDAKRTVVDIGYSVDFATYKLSYTYEVASGVLSNPTDVAQVAGVWHLSAEGFSSVPTYTFTSTVSPVEYTVVFNENAAGINAKPFFGDSWADYITKDAFAIDADKNWTVKANYNIESSVKEFPMALYRNGYCMLGYTFDKDDDANGVYNEMNDVFMDTAKMLGKDPANSIMLYAYWSVCNEGLTIKLEDTDKGTYKFTRTFDLGGGEKTPERIYEASTEYIQIPSIKEDISVTGMSFVTKNDAGVIVDDQSNFSYRKQSETKWNEISGNMFSVKVDIESIKAPLLKNSYEFIYDENTPQDVAIFVSPTLKKSESYTLVDVSESLNLQPLNVMGRTDACLIGWALDEKGDKELHSFDIDVLRKLDELAKAGHSVKTLYAVWEPESDGCKPETFTVTSGMTDEQGSFKVSYSFENKIYEFDVGKDGVEIPVIEGGEIAVKFNGTKAYKFGDIVTGVEDNGETAFEIENGNSFTVGFNQKDIALKVEAKLVEFHLVFDIPSDDAMFYGSDWTENGKYASIEENTVSFPTMVYDSDRCLAGWSINSESGTAWTDLNEDLVKALYAAYPDIESISDIKLFALWTDKVEDCVGNITRATIEMKHGDVQFVENIGTSKFVHKFNKKGTMLLPAEIESDNWTLSVSPDDGYKLDSLVILRGDTKIAVLHDGDHLPKDMKDVVLKAYFIKNNETSTKDSSIKIVEKSFDRSGNAIRIVYKASAFDSTRNVFAKVKIVDIAEEKPPVIDTSLSNPVAPSSSNEVVLYVLYPGTYKMLFSIGDKDESDEFSEEFVVKSQIASLDANRWQMLSLAAVDTSSITWDEGCSFYWWDETSVGEYWQYRSFKRGDEVVSNRGFWFSPWNGGSLVMRSDFKDDNEDIVWDLDSLISGWNLVANPHGWYVDLYSMNESAHKNVDEESDVRFCRYNAETGGYEEENLRYLAPYEAVWVHVSKKTKWKISAEPVFGVVSVKSEDRVYDHPALESQGKVVAKSALAKASTADRWMLQAVLTDKKGRRDSWNILGASNNPFVADEPPVVMDDHVNLSIVEGKRALAKSFKSANEEMEWTLELSASSNREGFLSFAGVDGVNSFGYHVFVTIEGKTTEMHEGKPLPVSLHSSKKIATVRVARSARVISKNVIKGLRSIAAGNQLHVSFDASEGLAGERTQVELLDVKGKVVATASARTLSGTNNVAMKQPKMGVYILRVRVGSQQQTQRIMVK